MIYVYTVIKDEYGGGLYFIRADSKVKADFIAETTFQFRLKYLSTLSEFYLDIFNSRDDIIDYTYIESIDG